MALGEVFNQDPPPITQCGDSLSPAPRSPRQLICRIPHRRGSEKEGSLQLDFFRPNPEHPAKSTGRDGEGPVQALSPNRLGIDARFAQQDLSSANYERSMERSDGRRNTDSIHCG